MSSRTKINPEIRVGAFVVSAVLLVMGALLALGGTNSIFARQAYYEMHLPTGEGLLPGAKVMLSGVLVGRVSELDLDPKTRDIRAELQILHKYTDWIRQDSYAELANLGLLGDKYVIINHGGAESPALPEGSNIAYREAGTLTQMLSKSDELMANLSSATKSLDRLLRSLDSSDKTEGTFKNLGQAMKNLNNATAKLDRELDGLELKKITKNLESITSKINNGNGTIGAMINDPGLYDDMKALVGSANRNRIVRNLVRKTIQDAEEKK